jgi:hypothetical protein
MALVVQEGQFMSLTLDLGKITAHLLEVLPDVESAPVPLQGIDAHAP